MITFSCPVHVGNRLYDKHNNYLGVVLNVRANTALDAYELHTSAGQSMEYPEDFASTRVRVGRPPWLLHNLEQRRERATGVV